MLPVLGRFVNRNVKSGLVYELALALVLNWTALVTMTPNRLVIRAYALRSLSKSLVRSRGPRSGGTKPQLLQRLLDDDAKPQLECHYSEVIF
jgi:hypothetical protein